MKKIRLFFLSLHRVMGTIISLFFLMWFITGLVLIYHPFPNLTKEMKYDKMEILPAGLPPINEIVSRIPGGIEIKKISVREFQKQTLFTIATKDSTYTLCHDSTEKIKPITKEFLERTAQHWVNATILKIDTLHEREQWIMYTRYEKEMPIYKFYFDDKAKHQLYISSKTGEIQQFTNNKERFLAYIGAIPHTFYFPPLRKHTKIWINALTIFGAIALLTALSGIYIGTRTYYKVYRKRKKIKSPYKKNSYSWHHISGTIFGLFLASWAFSGAMALQKVPQWMVKTHNNYKISSSKINGTKLSFEKYLLDYRTVKEFYPQLKELEWSNFQDIPTYKIIEGMHSRTIDASNKELKELYIPESEINKSIKKIHGDTIPFKISLMNEYDEYYLSLKNKLALPVYKVEVADIDHSRYYINPKNGNYKYVNKSRKAKKWIFSGLHYLNLKFFVNKPILWTFTIWLLCLGGALVSATGFYLSIRFLKRKIKKMSLNTDKN